MGKISFAEKAAVAAGSIAAVTAPATAQAKVVHVTGSPVSLTLGGGPNFASWDVDGAGGDEFRLNRKLSSFGTTQSNTITIQPPGTGQSYQYQYRAFQANYRRENIALASSDTYGAQQLNGRGIVGPNAFSNRVQALANSFNVGPTLAAYHWGATPGTSRYALNRYDRNWRSYTYYGGYFGPHYSSSAGVGSSKFPGFDQNGDNIIGFRFDKNGDMHYGWAKVGWDLTSPAIGEFIIWEWAYEDQPDTAIHASSTEVVPVPATIVPAIAMLAVGAAGVRRMRKRQST